jgi:hypothetical protein
MDPDPAENVGIDVAVPPEAAWPVLADVTRIPEWRAHIAEVRWLDEPGVGARFEGVSTFLVWRHLRLVCRITEWEPPHHLRYVVTEGPIRADSLWGIRPTPEGCHVYSTGDIVGASWSTRLLRPIARPLYLNQTQRELRRLHDLLEAVHDAPRQQ